ncbi:uncharacterized protein LOC107457766 [Arachis duranensis]|uniref:Uncharacterized protein LOC107457766 n=1 Tax=Arachis duranensis TaxID=130453 RepID=A0A6P4BJE6_ARADU|nr:uncharacterized protein LOC107457766 [Arachis duranensis]
MAKASEEADLWLHHNTTTPDLALTEFGFPSEFPYEFDSFGLEPLSSPPVESVAGSTETESSDEEDFFAGLTRRLSQATVHETRNQQLSSVPISNSDKAEREKTTRVLAGSPQSILSGIGSWSGRSAGSGDGSPEGGCSRVSSPFSAANDAWEVISAAAGQVARLKMHAGSPTATAAASKLDFQTRGVLGGLPHSTASFGNPNLSQIYNHAPQVPYQTVMQEHLFKQQCSSVLGRQGNNNKPISWSSQQLRGGVKCVRVLPQSSAWHNLHQVKNHQNQPHIARAGSGSRPVFQSGSGAGGIKRGCAGTGVFLPRQYGAPPPETRKKTSCAPVVVPAKVMHALNFNNNDLNVNAATTTSTQQQRFTRAFSDYDALLARRNALLIQQQRLAAALRREETATYEAALPQEWTY